MIYVQAANVGFRAVTGAGRLYLMASKPDPNAVVPPGAGRGVPGWLVGSASRGALRRQRPPISLTARAYARILLFRFVLALHDAGEAEEVFDVQELFRLRCA